MDKVEKNRMIKDEKNIWERNYQNYRYNCYPYDKVVSYTIKNIKPGVVVVDLGCGGGNHSKFFLDRGHKVIAVDASPKSIEITKIFCGKHPNLVCLNNEFTSLDIENESVDFILDRGSIVCNTLGNIKIIISELYRILKTNGRILSFMPSLNNSQLESIEKNETNDYIIATGYYSEVGLLHYTSIQELEELYLQFTIKDITIMTEKSYRTGNQIEWYMIDIEKQLRA